MRIAILVTHLLGTGHLKRASLIADGFARAGHEAIVISGGFPARHARPELATLVQLSGIRSDTSFSALYCEEGLATPALYARRRIEIGETLGGFAPDMLITELFPFGRRKLAAEFEFAIEAAGDAVIYSSIRDILQYPRKDGRSAEAEKRFANLYQGAFVHGDPALVPLDESWPLPAYLSDKIAYTGYIAETGTVPASPSDLGKGEVIVAAGGGSVGDHLFAVAAEAGNSNWRLLVGGQDREKRIAELEARAGKTMVEPTRPDFQTLLANADLAILQCGYNTAMDVVQSGVQALFVPFEGDGETEQITRARAFSERFGCGLVREKNLNASSLFEEISRISAAPKPDYRNISLSGVERTVALAEAALAERA